MFETITVPADTPISVDDAKTQLALTISEYDGLIDSLIRTAVGIAETNLNGCILDSVRRFYTDRFTPVIRIPHGLIHDVATVEYRTVDGQWHTLDTGVWEFATVGGQCIVHPRSGQSFPSVTLASYASVRITFTSGFGTTPETVPAPVPHALRLIVAYLFEHRDDAEQAMPAAAGYLLAPFRTVTQEMF